MSDQHEDNKLVVERRNKLTAIREQGVAFPNDFRRYAMAADLLERHEEHDKEYLEGAAIEVSVAGRLMSKRIMGKASFAHIQDASGKIQLFVQRDALPEGFYNENFKSWDVGDIIGARGELFRTKVGELSIRVSEIQLLTKSLRPLPEKFTNLGTK